MDTDELLERWADGWTAHDADRLASIFTENCVYEDVTLGLVHRSAAEIKSFRSAYVSVFPDLAVDHMSHFESGDSICLEWTMSGTHEGDLSDLPATQRRFVLRGVSVLTREGDQLASCRDYWDRNSLLQQLTAES
jgi:steroid delta-isomerase-like uncharacterized protein